MSNNVYDTRPLRRDLFIVIGNDFTFSVQWLDTITQEPIPLTGYTVVGTVVLADGSTLTLSTTGSDLSTGLNNFSLSDTATVDLLPQSGRWTMDVTDPSGFKRTYVNGDVRLFAKTDVRNQ